jgi:hypothetical protein
MIRANQIIDSSLRAKRSNPAPPLGVDCFVAALLAKTGVSQLDPITVQSAACAHPTSLSRTLVATGPTMRDRRHP